MHCKAIASLIFLGWLPVAAVAGEAQSILEKARAKQLERWEGVNAYRVDQSLAGNRVTMDFQRVETKGPDGRPFVMFEPSQTRATGSNAAGTAGQTMSAQDLEAFAQGQEMVGEGLATSIEDGLEQAGLPRGLLGASGSDPTATFDPRVMMGANAQFLRGAAQAQQNQDARAALRDQDHQAAAADMAAFSEKARLIGREIVDGRDAFHLRAEGLNHTQKADGEEFTLQSVSLWIDSSEYVPLRTRMDGIAKSKGETRPITIERLDGDYRKVQGSKMYEPYRQVMRMSGVVSPEQQQQMREAQKQMAEMEQQLASMPEGQRQMIMRQMGPQMQMMKSMAAGGGFEMVTEIHQISINPALEAAQPAALPSAAVAASGAAAAVPVAAVTTPAPPAAPDDAAARRQAEEACLKNKMAKAQAAQKKKRGFGTLLNAAGRAAGMLGNQDLVTAAGDVAAASATAGDLTSAARDLGITEDEIAACQGSK